MKIVIVGGTHGNEKTGVYLADNWANSTSELEPKHEYKIIFGNPEAIQRHQRFKDFDLNRSFNSKETHDYEKIRSQEIIEEVNIWAKDKPFFLIDMHTTTTNMGATLVLSKNDRFTAHVIAKTLTKIPNLNILFGAGIGQDYPFVDSLAPHGLLVEIGPVAQNIYDANIIAQTRTLVQSLLTSIKELESEKELTPITIDGYKEFGVQKFPISKSDVLSAIIHPNLLGQDYKALNTGNPIFLTQDGKNIYYENEETIYPIFINEAAYLKDNIAFLVSRKCTLKF